MAWSPRRGSAYDAMNMICVMLVVGRHGLVATVWQHVRRHEHDLRHARRPAAMAWISTVWQQKNKREETSSQSPRGLLITPSSNVPCPNITVVIPSRANQLPTIEESVRRGNCRERVPTSEHSFVLRRQFRPYSSCNAERSNNKAHGSRSGQQRTLAVAVARGATQWWKRSKASTDVRINAQVASAAAPIESEDDSMGAADQGKQRANSRVKLAGGGGGEHHSPHTAKRDGYTAGGDGPRNQMPLSTATSGRKKVSIHDWPFEVSAAKRAGSPRESGDEMPGAATGRGGAKVLAGCAGTGGTAGTKRQRRKSAGDEEHRERNQAAAAADVWTVSTVVQSCATVCRFAKLFDRKGQAQFRGNKRQQQPHQR